MEALLSLAFDNLSSYDKSKICKGLRQVEGLLGNLCLAPGASGAKPLIEVADDPAFREFFKLQEGFEWNVALRLVGALDRLLATGSEGRNDLVILNALDLIQGLMLLHPPSKALFARDQHMNLLLDLLEPSWCPAIQAATLLTLVAALVENPRNTRAFEDADGLLTITSLFRSRETARDVKLKLVEFLYFYLMPETPTVPHADVRGGSVRLTGRRGADVAGEEPTRTTVEKQEMLGRHLSNVEDLVKDLRNCVPFGGVVC